MTRKATTATTRAPQRRPRKLPPDTFPYERVVDFLCMAFAAPEGSMNRLRGAREHLYGLRALLDNLPDTNAELLLERARMVQNRLQQWFDTQGAQLEQSTQPGSPKFRRTCLQELRGLQVTHGPLRWDETTSFSTQQGVLRLAPRPLVLYLDGQAVPLGTTELNLLLEWNGLRPSVTVKLLPRDNQHRTPAGRKCRMHPHADLDGHLCLKVETHTLLRNALDDGRIGDAVLLAESVWSAYSRASSYTSLSHVLYCLRWCPALQALYPQGWPDLGEGYDPDTGLDDHDRYGGYLGDDEHDEQEEADDGDDECVSDTSD